MSKSRGNVINPDDIIKKFGADSLRAYIMFIGPYDQESIWSMNGLKGVHRFLNRVWGNQSKVSDIEDSDKLRIKLNQTIAGVTEDLDHFQFNTVISKLMELNNAIEKAGKISKKSWQKFLALLYPAMPHIAEELWEKSGAEGLIENQSWPKTDKKYLITPKITIAVQINGKTRDTVEISTEAAQADAESAAKTEKIKNLIGSGKIAKVIYVSGRIINFVLE
jgi:leucyl-tRNA synthetase